MSDCDELTPIRTFPDVECDSCHDARAFYSLHHSSLVTGHMFKPYFVCGRCLMKIFRYGGLIE